MIKCSTPECPGSGQEGECCEECGAEIGKEPIKPKTVECKGIRKKDGKPCTAILIEGETKKFCKGCGNPVDPQLFQEDKDTDYCDECGNEKGIATECKTCIQTKGMPFYVTKIMI